MDLSWQQIPFPILLLDEKSKILAASRVATEQLASSGELLGQTLQQVMGGPLSAPLDGSLVVLGEPRRKVKLQVRPITVGSTNGQMVTWFLWPEPKPQADVAPIRILVAEDEPSIRDICRRVLTDAGYDVVAVENGQIAIDILRDSGPSFDLIVADIVMPVAGGEAILNHLRTDGLDIPILYTSGYGHRSSAVEFLQRETVTLLRKPYSLSQLLLAVKGLLTDNTLAAAKEG